MNQKWWECQKLPPSMDILSHLLKPKIFNKWRIFLLGLRFTIQSDIQINLNSYNTFTGNVILDLHAVPGFGIATFFVVDLDEVDEPWTYYQTSSNTRRCSCNVFLGRILIMRETTTYRPLRRVQQNKSLMQEQWRSSFWSFE